MLAAERTILVLLAAGRSERFGGAESKLDRDLGGRPLGLHVAVALRELPFRARVAVVGHTTIDYARYGFDVVPNDDGGTGMASSVRLGVAAARAGGAAAVLIALADMPRVGAAHVARLFAAATAGPASVVASSDGCRPQPPAIIGRDHFAALLSLGGDAGARDLLRGGCHVIAPPAELVDVDTPEALERLRALHPRRI